MSSSIKSSSTYSNSPLKSSNSRRNEIPLIESYTNLLLNLNYSNSNNNKIQLLKSFKWVESSLAGKQFLSWSRDAFSNKLDEISIQTEERELFDKALVLGFVKAIPKLESDEDLDPELLLYPSDYRTPRDISDMIAENEEGMKLLSDHIERKEKRFATLLLEVEHIKSRNLNLETTLTKINHSLAISENELKIESKQLQSSISTIIETISTSSQNLSSTCNPHTEKFSSSIDKILTNSVDFNSLLVQFSNFIPSISDLSQASTMSNVEIDTLVFQTGKLEIEGLFESSTTTELSLIDVASREFESLSIEELEILLAEEEKETGRASESYSKIVEDRVKAEIETSRNRQRIAEIERSMSFITLLKSSIESELSSLLFTHNSLSKTHDTLINFSILSLVLQNILDEISSLTPSTAIPTIPTPTTISSNQISAERNEELLLKAVESLSKVPILNRVDLEKALEEVEDLYLTRIEECEKVVEINNRNSSLLQAHLNLYSQTSILKPISSSIESLVSKSISKESEFKALLSSEVANSKNVEITKKEREVLKRLDLLLKEV